MNIVKLICILVGINLLCSFSFADAKKTGELHCTISSENFETVSNSVDIMQNSDGTGGLADLKVYGDVIICHASAVAKFDLKSLIKLEIEVSSGEKIGNTNVDRDYGILNYSYTQGNQDLSASCTCLVK